MINASQIRFDEKIYGDPSGQVAVYKGWYCPVNPDGQKEQHQVAIKELKIPADNASVISGIMQEITIQLKLEGCEFVCKCYGYFDAEGKIYIVSELLDCDLDKDMKVRQGQPYDEGELMEWLYKINSALDFARQKVLSMQSIAHRDIKPQNILFTLRNEEGKRSIRLVDFGSGAIADGKAHKLTGTPLYMSPEQIPILQEFQRTGRLPETSYNPFKSDVYSLGVTFLQMALLEPPVQLLVGNREAAIDAYLSRIMQKYPTLHSTLREMLDSVPERRPDFPRIHSQLKGSSTPYDLTVSEGVRKNPPQSVISEKKQCAWCYKSFSDDQLEQIQYEGAFYFRCQECHYSQTSAQEQSQAAPQEQYSAHQEVQPIQNQYAGSAAPLSYPGATQGPYEDPATSAQYSGSAQVHYENPATHYHGVEQVHYEAPPAPPQYPGNPQAQYGDPAAPSLYSGTQEQFVAAAAPQFSETEVSPELKQSRFECGNCRNENQIIVKNYLEVRMWFCGCCFSPWKVEVLQ